MTVIDNFTRSGSETSPYRLENHTSDTGSTWSMLTGGAGGIVLTATDVYPAIAGGVLTYLSNASVGSDADYEAGVSFKILSFPSNSRCNVTIRGALNQGILLGNTFSIGDGSSVIYIQDQGNGYTARATLSCPAGTFEAGKTYLIVGKAVGNTFYCSIKSYSAGYWLSSSGVFNSPTRVSCLSVSVAGQSQQGKAGITFYSDSVNTDTTGLHVDSFLIGEPDTLDYPPATSTTISGSSVGTVGAATTITVGADGEITGTLTITPTSSDGRDVISPTSVQINNTSRTATFTITASTTGSRNISLSNNGGLLNPSAFVFAVYPATSITSGLFFSPYNWRFNGSVYAESNNPGSYLKFNFTGTTLTLSVDTSATVTYPTIRVIIDNKTPADIQLTSATTISLASGLTDTQHECLIVFLKTNYNAERWANSNNSVRITNVSSDGIITAITPQTKRMLFFGDSITEGLAQGSDDATRNYAAIVGQALGAEYGQVGFGSQGWNWGGSGSVPAFSSAWNLYSSGNSRLVGGLLSPMPDYICVCHGTNDALNSVSDATVTSSVAGWLTAVRAAAPTAKIFVIIPFGGFKRSAITTAVNSSSVGSVYLIDLGVEAQKGLTGFALGANNYSTDGIHPNFYNSGRLAAILTQAIQSILARKGSSSIGLGF